MWTSHLNDMNIRFDVLPFLIGLVEMDQLIPSELFILLQRFELDILGASSLVGEWAFHRVKIMCANGRQGSLATDVVVKSFLTGMAR